MLKNCTVELNQTGGYWSLNFSDNFEITAENPGKLIDKAISHHANNKFLFINKKEVIMKFMISWKIQADKKHDVVKAFSAMSPEDDVRDAGEKIKIIGRWHDMSAATGVVICETDDLKALFGWSLNWNGVLDVTVVPVVDDAESREIGKKKFH